MNYNKTVIQFGELTIEVVRENTEELIKEISYINNLNRALEGRSAMPFFETRGGYDFFGFRDANGNEVLFGHEKNPSDPSRAFFSWRTGAQTKDGHGYKGWQQPQLPEHASGDGAATREPEVNGAAVAKPQGVNEQLLKLTRQLNTAQEQGLDRLRSGIEFYWKEIDKWPQEIRQEASNIIKSFETGLELQENPDGLPF